MNVTERIEQALESAMAPVETPPCPPRLAAAMRHAVFPRGARIRPRLCLAVAGACGEDAPAVTDAAAVAIELMHCASLVHDDLPCFDDAATRRGRPSVHHAFGQPLAVLAGDALIVLAYQALAAGGGAAPARLGPLLAALGRAVGAPTGIVAGQAWECEPEIDIAVYQRAKTGALFAAAAIAGAASAGAVCEPWREFGEGVGEAFQVADDIRDVAASTEEIGKPVGRDAALGRPSVALRLGLDGAAEHFHGLIEAALDAIPPCPGGAGLRALIQVEAHRFLPARLARRAA